MRSLSEASFVELEHTPRHPQRYCLWHEGSAVPKGLVVYVHPFAEEMNKARRMAALQSRALAAAGYAVLQLDLLGCGDSAGDFGDATWDDWVADVVAARGIAMQRFAQRWPAEPQPPLWLWGLRAGCLLARAAASRMDAPCNFLFWQPSPSGKLALQQFLRLKLAASLGQSNARTVSDALRQDLAAMRHVHVAGYRLSPALAAGLEQATLEPTAQPSRVLWLETSPQPEPALMPASLETAARWRTAGHEVLTSVVRGPAFWSTVEVEDAPGLIAASTRCMLTAA